MRYYTDGGNGIARLHTDPDTGYEHTQFWNYKTTDWKGAIAGATATIHFSGDYQQCTEAQAHDAITVATARHQANAQRRRNLAE